MRGAWKAAVLAGLAMCAAGPARAAIDYRVSLERPEEHVFHVTMTIPDVSGGVEVQMPAWNALYQVRDFASRVMDVRARDAAGQRLPVEKRDLHTWHVAGSGTVSISYGTYWDDGGPFAAQLDSNHAFINLAMILFYVPDRRGEESRVQFTGLLPGWDSAVALAKGSAPHSFRAASYDMLVDAPVEIGRFEQFGFTKQGARIRVVVHGDRWSRAGLEDKLRRIVAYQVQLMGGAPFEEFLFIYHFGSGGGGMEHANSTAIHAGSDANVEGIAAHEFFHLWNVKRIRPRTLEPVEYVRPNITRALWFAEGVTSTYASYTLVRSGLRTPQEFYDELAGEIAQLEQRPASRWKSAEEASLDAWFEGSRLYRQPKFSISYYNKGQILGVLLDILIRDATDNRRSLDDVLRLLNEEAERGRFYDDSAGIRAAVEKVSGVSFAEFFQRYIAGAEPLPYEDILRRAGLGIEMQSGSVTIKEDSAASERPRSIRTGLLQGTTN
jgi:predicted metalloprotease with PDZ domain